MPEVTIKCGQCGYDNEPQRVYCHSCGSKLDRSLVPKDEAKKKAESPEVARKRIKKMTNPSSTSFLRELKTFLSVIGGAAAVAALYLFVQKPEGVPPDKQQLPSRLVQSDLADAISSPRPVAVTFTEDDVNAYLQKAVKAGAGVVPGIEFRRMWIRFIDNGVVGVGTEQSVWSYPVYSGMKFQVEMVDGKLKATSNGGNFGRLSVHPKLMGFVDFAFRKLWTAMQRDRQQIEKMQSVTVSKGKVTLVTRGAAR